MPAQLSLQRTNDDQKKMLDYISDGQWYTRTKMVNSVTNKKSLEIVAPIHEYIEDFASGGYLITGENDSFRLREKYVLQWRKKRGVNLTAKHEPRYFGGILEDDGWLEAPLLSKQLVHFRADSALGKRDIEELLRDRVEDFSVTIDEAGLIRVITDEGSVVYRALQDISKHHSEYQIKGVRLATDVKRRNREDLPPRFLDDLCEFYGKFSNVLLRKSWSSITAHIKDPEDIQQQIYIWIMDAVERYDETTAIPFAAYLSTVMNRWVHNLNRAAHGRSIADSELKHTRAIIKFENENNRKPTIEELSYVLGESVNKVRQDAYSVSVVTNLRSTTTLNSEDFTIPLIASDTSTENIENDLDKTTLTLALINEATGQLNATGNKSASALFRVVDKTWNHDRRLSGFYKGIPSKELDDLEVSLMEAMKSRIEDAYSH